MITISDVVKLDELSRGNCVMAVNSLEVEVTGINIMDTQDMKNWIKQGELIIVGGEYIKVFLRKIICYKLLKEKLVAL